MKRIFVSLSLVLTAGLATVFANDETNASEKLKEAFRKEFARAEIVKWSDVGEYHVATFVFGGRSAEAYFNTDCELLGSIRELLSYELPLVVIRSLDNRFAGADIIQTREITNTEGTFYRVLLETQQRKYLIKVSANGYFSEIVKKKK
jgi:hypothetical protein